MASYTPNLNLKKPTTSEMYNVLDWNDNSDKIDTAYGTLNSHITINRAVSGATNAEFVSNLVSAVNSLIPLPGVSIGTTLLGNAEWSGTTFCQFMMTKVGSNACNIHITNGATKDIIARVAIDNFSVSNVSDIYEQFEANQPYTPDITSASTGFAVANKVFVYARAGKILLINGRFEITNVGSDTSKDIAFTLPSGMECYDHVGACGFMAFNKNVANAEKLSLRQGINNYFTQVGAGGSGTLSIVGTGYIMLNAVIMLK